LSIYLSLNQNLTEREFQTDEQNSYKLFRSPKENGNGRIA
ncbi:MAG: hypothetical protein ACI85U_003121, partial [Candidatus Promineifilaceae bacterium]